MRSAIILMVPKTARPTLRVRPTTLPWRLRTAEMRCNVRSIPARLSPLKGLIREVTYFISSSVTSWGERTISRWGKRASGGRPRSITTSRRSWSSVSWARGRLTCGGSAARKASRSSTICFISGTGCFISGTGGNKGGLAGPGDQLFHQQGVLPYLAEAIGHEKPLQLLLEGEGKAEKRATAPQPSQGVAQQPLQALRGGQDFQGAPSPFLLQPEPALGPSLLFPDPFCSPPLLALPPLLKAHALR